MVLGGCAVGPDYVPPDTPMPDAWHQEATRGLAEGTADLQRWWTLLEDPTLESLIKRAVAGNVDLRTAVGRIAEARARVGIERGAFLPQIDASGAYSHLRASEHGLVPGDGDTSDLHDVGLGAVWEIDVFGRIRRSVESAHASLEATVEDYRDVLVSLHAEVALTYVEVRTLQARLRYARANAEAQRTTVELTKNRRQAELAPALDVSQAELNLANTEARIPALQAALIRSINRLGVLLGESPGALRSELLPEGPIPGTPEKVLVGLPADLLRQRPDIRRAERELAAQTARIGIATSELYPRFSLFGDFFFQSTELSDLFNGSSRGWSVGPTFTWKLFAGGRIRSAIRAEEAGTEQVLAAYENTVLLALEEVENSMTAYGEELERRDALRRAVDAAQRSAELVQTLYTTGLTNFQNVLDMERSLTAAQDELATSEGAVVQNLIRIYRALGGGWAPELTAGGAAAGHDELDKTSSRKAATKRPSD
jgi:NodT family efflux transporter outer membrane factor (OMF) lipoprotein